MHELALFAGAGGGILGSHLAGWRTVAAVELDEFCRDRLIQRQSEGHLPHFPIWDDVRTFDGRPFRGVVDLVSAGFPCQPFSLAGRQAAADDPRNMWPDTIRIIREIRPKFCLLENVPGLLAGSHGYFGQVLGELAESGFDAVWRVLSAADVGAAHLRKRLWVVAYSDSQRGRAQQKRELGCSYSAISRDDGKAGPMADTDSGGRHGKGRVGLAIPRPEAVEQATGCSQGERCRWPIEPDVGRVAYGVANRLDRLRAIGNGQVPAVVLRVLRDAGLA